MLKFNQPLTPTLEPRGPQGLSAYQVAVQNGFAGTMQQWLASLIGPPVDPAAMINATAAANAATTAASTATATAASATIAANADAAATAADRTAVHADRVQADADAVATGADRVATGANAAAAATSAASAATAKTATAAAAAATAADRTAVHADRGQADADAVATAGDRVAVHADRVQADADAVATAADRVATAGNAAASATGAANGAGVASLARFRSGFSVVRTAQVTWSDFAGAASKTDMVLVQAQIAALAAYGQGPVALTLSALTGCIPQNSNMAAGGRTARTNNASSVTFAQILAAYFVSGLRSTTVVAAGGTYFVEGAMATANAIYGIGVGFDGGSTTGEFQPWTAGNIFLIWRQDGNLVALREATDSSMGESTPAGVTMTLASGTATTWTTTDTARVTFMASAASATSGTLTLTKNGAQVATYTISGLTAGMYFCGAIHQANTSATLTRMSVQIPTAIPVAAALTTDPETMLAQYFRLSHMAPVSAVGPSANVFLPRVTPPGFPAFPFNLLAVYEPGCVVVDKSVIMAFWLKYSAQIIGFPVAYVDPVYGSDVTGAVNSGTAPYRSVQAAANAGARIVSVNPGEIDVWTWRMDQAGTHPLAVIATVPGSVTVRVQGGDDLGSLAWTPVAGQANVYQATLAAANKVVSKITVCGQHDGRYFDRRLPVYYSLASLPANGYGWYVTGTNIYVTMAGENVQLQRKRLKAYVLDSAGNSQIFVYGSTIAWAGLRFENIQPYVSDYIAGAVVTPAEVWQQQCVQFMSHNSYGNLVRGGIVYSDRVWSHAAGGDSWNYDIGANGSLSGGMEINCCSTDAGDWWHSRFIDNTGATIFPNINGSSSHSGWIVRWGCLFYGSYGPVIADTANLAIANLTWCVGVWASSPDPRAAAPFNTALLLQGSNATPASPNQRKGWADTCAFGDAASGSRFLSYYASLKEFSLLVDGAAVNDSTCVAPVAYAPGAP